MFDKTISAAEVEFARMGFDGVGMKVFALRAGASQSLPHYQFGSKDRLYKDVIRQRSKLVNDERMVLLRAVDMMQGDALDRIFEALFNPALGHSGD